MTGRGIDQVLPHPSDPRIHEPYLKDALGYLRIAEEVSGPIPKPVDFDYIWGDALGELRRRSPDVRIINLETSVTTSDDYWSGKGINYRMHPKNVPCLTVAAVDCCVLANNHVLDWGEAGLEETLATLSAAGIDTAGAGRHRGEASAPAVLEVGGKGRVLVFGVGSGSSGIPWRWGATPQKLGVDLLRDLSRKTVQEIADRIRALKRARDLVIVSIHWGGNWGYDIPEEQRQFAHLLIDQAGVDVVHGHSSHHPKGIEVYRDKLILYGCGDFLNDYEGIGGKEQFRGDLALMYFPTLDAVTGRLQRLLMMPMRIRRFRLNRVSSQDAEWLRDTLDRESRKLGSAVGLSDDGELILQLR